MIFIKLLHICVHPLRVGHVLNLFRWLWSHLSSPLLNKSTLPQLQSSLQTLPLHPLGAPRPPQTPCSPTASWPRDSLHPRMFWAGLVYTWVSVFYNRGVKLENVSRYDESRHSFSVFPAVPWFVNELGEPVALAPPPPYSYDPNGSDLPRGQREPPPFLIISCIFVFVTFFFFFSSLDCKVLQYYYNLGVQVSGFFAFYCHIVNSREL